MRQVRLPDGLEIRAPSPIEAAILYREIVMERTYERHGIHVRSGDIVFDVGANVGLFAIHLTRSVPGVRVHAFEPIPPLFEALTRNLAQHAPEVQTWNVALAEREGEAVFELDRFMMLAATMHPDALRKGADRNAPASAWAAAAIADLHRLRPGAVTRLTGRALAHPVGRVVTLTALAPLAAVLDVRRRLFLERHRCRLQTLPAAMHAAGVDRIDLVKLDVEGAEAAVVAGVDDRTWPRIRQLVIEVHDVEGRLDLLRALLEGHGYRTTPDREDWALHELLGIHTLYATRA